MSIEQAFSFGARARRTAAAACFLWLGSVAAASAQDLTPPAGFDEMFMDLTTNSLTGEELRTLDSFDTISVVVLDEAVAESGREALQDVLDESEDGFAEVQTAIRGNELLEAAFEEKGIDLRLVRAVTGEEGGDLTVYLDEPVIRF